MKTLYESILDDEDVLVDNVKRDLDNPLLCLYNIYKNTNNDFNRDKKSAQKFSNKLVKILNLKNGSAQILESSISISTTEFINQPILFIVFDNISMYMNIKPKCIVFKLSTRNNTLSKQDIKNFSNKCNLKKINNDTWILK